jgi:hypothetical protein
VHAQDAHNPPAATPEVALRRRLRSGQGEPATFFLASRDDIMSVLQMFLPASEPARSEALEQFRRTHHLPRHLVRGIGRKTQGEPGPIAFIGPVQSQQQAASPPLRTPAAPE